MKQPREKCCLPLLNIISLFWYLVSRNDEYTSFLSIRTMKRLELLKTVIKDCISYCEAAKLQKNFANSWLNATSKKWDWNLRCQGFLEKKYMSFAATKWEISLAATKWEMSLAAINCRSPLQLSIGDLPCSYKWKISLAAINGRDPLQL